MGQHLIKSDAAIRSIRPGDRRNRLSDRAGLYLRLFVNDEPGWGFITCLLERILQNVPFGTYATFVYLVSSQGRQRAVRAKARLGSPARSRGEIGAVCTTMVDARGRTRRVPIAIALGDVIRRARQAMGMSQEELATTSGIDRAYLSNVECGKALVSVAVVVRTARAIGLSGADLIAEAGL